MTDEQIERADLWNRGLWPEDVYNTFIGHTEWIMDLDTDSCITLMCLLVLASGK